MPDSPSSSSAESSRDSSSSIPPPLASSTRSSSTSLSLECSASRTPSILRTASACTLPERGNGSVRFAPLPAIEPRRRKSSVQLGVAARSRMLRQRRMLREQGEFLQAHPDAAGWGPEEGEVHFHQEDVRHAHTPQDKAKFLKLFLQCGPANGLLSGEKARDVFVKSKLPVDKLSQIWSLADTKNRGALDATDFAIAMHLIQASMSGQIPNIPSTLPPSLYEQAGGKSPFEQVVPHATGDSMSYSPSLSGVYPGRPVSTIQPQFTGSGSILQPQLTEQLKPGSSAPPFPARFALGTSTSVFPFAQAPAALPAQHWGATPAGKDSADRLFAGLNAQVIVSGAGLACIWSPCRS